MFHAKINNDDQFIIEVNAKYVLVDGKELLTKQAIQDPDVLIVHTIWPDKKLPFNIWNFQSGSIMVSCFDDESKEQIEIICPKGEISIRLDLNNDYPTVSVSY